MIASVAGDEGRTMTEDEDEHGEHVFVRAVEVVDDDRPAWAFHCGHHD